MSLPQPQMPEASPLQLRWTEPGRAHIEIGQQLCAGTGALFGGWALAAAVQAAEQATSRQVRASHVSFLAPVRVGDRLALSIRSLTAASRTGHVSIAGRTASGEVLAALVLLSDSERAAGRGWGEMPVVPDPADCPPRAYRDTRPGTVNGVLDVRVASAEPAPNGANGRVLLWGRLTVPTPATSAVAVLSDHVPYLTAQTLPGIRFATTVSATVRFTAEPLTEYTLLDVRLRWADGWYCYGVVTMWSATGRRVGSGEQTLRTVYTAAHDGTHHGRRT